MGFKQVAVIVGLTAVVLQLIPSLFRESLPNVVKGYAAPGWESVADVFKRHVEEGLEQGGAVAVWHRGDLVVEYWGGYADVEAQRPWTKETVTCLFSATKGVTATVAAILVDRGLVEYDTPIATYWPEFAQSGKEKISLRQILSHTAGLAAIDEPLTVQDITENPKKVSEALAAQKPLWGPGTDHGYHGLTLGLYMDQIVRRVDPQGRDISQFFREEVAEPFEIDLFIGLPLEENHRCARMYKPALWSMFATRSWSVLQMFLAMIFNSNSETARMISNPSGFTADRANDPAVRASPCGSTRGFSTAAGVAKLYSIIANGGQYNQETLLSPEAIKEMIVPQVTGPDRIAKMNVTYTTGYMMLQPWSDRPPQYGTPGSGGQMAFMDIKNNLAWSYITNHHQLVDPLNDIRWTEVMDAVYKVLEKS